MRTSWEKLGTILTPDPAHHWLCSSAGAAFALCSDAERGLFNLYVTGRDDAGRSFIGLVTLDVERGEVSSVSPEPVMGLGEKGAFDENGTSYPCVVRRGPTYYLYYTGWVQGVQVPWINGLGLAVSEDGRKFERYSRAPILPRDDDDFIGVGSSFVLDEDGQSKLWYTRFDRWGSGGHDHKHYYNIRCAESTDGATWERNPAVCIDFRDASEYAISRPSVLQYDGRYFMWYSHRGAAYRIGLATSRDGCTWLRRDSEVGIKTSSTGWDSEMICYPHVFSHGDHLYLLYNGNGYGASGLGLARMDLGALERVS